MSRYLGIVFAALLAATMAPAQISRPQIDVQHYVIDAQINPRTQTLSAVVQVRFVPLADYTSEAVFELNNALKVAKVLDAEGRSISASRYQQDFTVRLTFPKPLVRGTPVTATFHYDGRLTGTEESPIYGIKFAAIHNDFAYLLSPSRWFPVNDYSTDRYTAEMRITVPAGNTVVAGDRGKMDQTDPENPVFSFAFTSPSLPGSLAVVQGAPTRIASGGVTTDVYFREQPEEVVSAYGDEIGRVMGYLTSVFGLPPRANLTVVATENGAPSGFSAPGILFLSPRSIGEKTNPRLLANQIARQWWEGLLSPVTRNHLWLQNGAARYAELLYTEQVFGEAALETEIRDTFIEALTVDTPPLSQSARLEDYSPEFWALTAGKGAAVFHMLRYVIGDENFFALLKQFPDKFAWTSVSTADFRETAEAITGSDLRYFFIQWIESSGAPEFRLDYTIFRTQTGFRVMGKIAQDLDTFRMPVELKIETEGNPEEERVDVMGTASEFIVETFGKPLSVQVDPNDRLLRYDDSTRVAVAIRRGEQFAEISEFSRALGEYQRALDVNRNSSLAHYRIAEVFFLQNNYQSAANEFREALNGDLEPSWTEVWCHINLGKIFDATGQRERAVNEYRLAIRTNDNTQGALEEATKYSQEPYQRERPSF